MTMTYHNQLPLGHLHPTWGVCLCGHDGVEHLWTSGMRVDYQGECMHRSPMCSCETFHADTPGGEGARAAAAERVAAKRAARVALAREGIDPGLVSP